MASIENVTVELNGLRFTLDAKTGGILELAYPGTGVMLDASRERAGVLDLAYPAAGFDPLRLAPRHSEEGVEIEKTDDSVVIHWEKLGLSRPFDLPGKVSATVLLRAAEDSRSVIMTCEIDNQSEHAVRQVLFPDLVGLLPFAGEDKTEFRAIGFVIKPFQDLKHTFEEGEFYGNSGNWRRYGSRVTAFDRWMDLGSLQGGFSLFPRVWSWGPVDSSGSPTSEWMFLHRSEIDGKLRVMYEHKVQIHPGEKWTSSEYVLTPHGHGWAAGIEPYRAWIRQNVDRPYPLPNHIRKSIGFRTAWMTEQFPEDPLGRSVNWKINDLVELARECKEHGIYEMSLWGILPWDFLKRVYEPIPQLGTAAELHEAIAEAKKIGVNISAFFNCMLLRGMETAEDLAKYGREPKDLAPSWIYHSELIPRFRAYYAMDRGSAFADQSSQQWQADALAYLNGLIDSGYSSNGWDQLCGTPVEPNVYTVAAKMRQRAKQRDPESSFSAECDQNIHMESRYVDYTWNWNWFSEEQDYRALTTVYPGPRLNVNVDSSPKAVKYCFVDNLFVNIMPSKPEGINGSAWIRNFPELSKALRQCAGLRKQFMPYFTDGQLIGDCILSKPCTIARINAYVLGEGAMIIVLNTGSDTQVIHFTCDFQRWIKSPSGCYEIKSYDDNGKALNVDESSDQKWRASTRRLQPLGMELYEISLKSL